MTTATGKRQRSNVINTYHCICTNFLLATTYSLPVLLRRAKPPSLDKSHILPVPALPRVLHRKLASSREGSGGGGIDYEYDDRASSPSEDGNEIEDTDKSDNDESASVDAVEKSDGSGRRSRGKDENFTLLTGLRTASTAVLIRRSDGFEKRWTVRCARCDLTVGYFLDWSQFGQQQQRRDSSRSSGPNEGPPMGVKSGRRDDLLYVLPGAITNTAEMKEGDRRSIFHDIPELSSQAA